jgi:hypothetical protein
MSSGTTKRGGTSQHYTAANFGLSTLTNILVSLADSGNSRGTTYVDFLPSASEATVYYFTASGATQTTGVSFNYLALGT